MARTKVKAKTKDKEARKNGGCEQSLRGCRLERRLSHRST